MRRLIAARAGVGLKGEQVAGLTVERLAQCFERRKANRARLSGLEDRQVGKRDTDSLCELGQSHPPGVKQVVEFDVDCHTYTVPSRSWRIRAPSANTRVSTNSRSTASQPLVEKPALRRNGCAGVETPLAIAPMTTLRS